LGRLPAGLFPLYDRMLKDIEPDSQELSLCILRYVALAYRPLSLDELAFVASSRSVRSDPHITGHNIRDLTEGCGPLFRIRDNTVTLVHESVRDYTKEATFPDGLGSNKRRTHLQIAWACINTLTQEIPQSPFAAYAKAFWPHHAIESDKLAVELFSHPSCFFARNSKLRSKWWKTYTPAERHAELLGYESISQLHMACFLGIKFWTEDILNKQKPRFANMSFMLRDPIAKRDRNGWTSLHWAAFGGQVATVELLLHRKANPDTKDANLGRTALHWAAKGGHEATVELLLRHTVNADTKSEIHGETALYLAAEGGHQTVAKVLLDHGANVNARMNFGWTALHMASVNEHTAFVKLLIDYGADVNAEEESGETAIYYAMEKQGWTDIEAVVKLLLEHGADANTKNKSNRTALHMAARNQHEPTIRLLLDHGADVNATDDNGRNVCYYTFESYMEWFYFEAILTLLLEHHIDINAKNRRGQTALLEILERKDSKALWKQNPDELSRLGICMRAMIRHGAQFDAESSEGRRILQLIGEGDS
jgi:ankyrin repeat protein